MTFRRTIYYIDTDIYARFFSYEKPFCDLFLTIEIIDIECVLGNLAGTQIEKKIALINPPCWICPRSGLCELQWGEFNLPL